LSSPLTCQGSLRSAAASTRAIVATLITLRTYSTVLALLLLFSVVDSHCLRRAWLGARSAWCCTDRTGLLHRVTLTWGDRKPGWNSVVVVTALGQVRTSSELCYRNSSGQGWPWVVACNACACTLALLQPSNIVACTLSRAGQRVTK
jgi:hypothetical protein